MKTIALKNGDLYLDADGNIAVVDGIEAVRQSVVTLLQMIKGEWVLDVTQGIPYMQEIFIINASESSVKNIYDKAVLSVDGVVTLLQSSGIITDRAQRKFSYAATVQTIYGKMEITTNG
jgi:hypothetical protein